MLCFVICLSGSLVGAPVRIFRLYTHNKFTNKNIVIMLLAVWRAKDPVFTRSILI
jgi:hypothetical protein